MRVPGIAYWRGMIAPGRESDELFDLMDLFNTSLHLAGIEDRLPTDRYIDGIDQTSFLLADDGRSNREKVYIWNEADLMAMRMYEYKIHVKVVESHAQWLDIDMTTVGGRRPRALALQPLHRPEGAVSGRPPDERLPRLDGGRDEGRTRRRSGSIRRRTSGWDSRATLTRGRPRPDMSAAKSGGRRPHPYNWAGFRLSR